MILQKIFFDSYGEDRLYSVLMSEEEIALFSKEDTNDKSRITPKAIVGAGVAGNAISGYLAMKEINKKEISDEEKKVLKNLLKDSKSKGIKIKQERDLGGPSYNPQSNLVNAAGSKNPSIIAHELGHAHYYKNRDAGIIGKAAHKAKRIVPTRLLNMSASIASGVDKARREERGEEERKILKHSGWATPLVTYSPTLVSEAAASKKGLKLLKKAGASKELMKASKKNLGAAFGTYATAAAIKSGIGLGTKEAAYRLEKKRLNKKEKNSNKDE